MEHTDDVEISRKFIPHSQDMDWAISIHSVELNKNSFRQLLDDRLSRILVRSDMTTFFNQLSSLKIKITSK